MFFVDHSRRFRDAASESASREKYALALSGKSMVPLRASCPTEGRLAIVTDAGRDAMDADGAARRAAPMRTAKSCGLYFEIS